MFHNECTGWVNKRDKPCFTIKHKKCKFSGFWNIFGFLMRKPRETNFCVNNQTFFYFIPNQTNLWIKNAEWEMKEEYLFRPILINC